MRRRTDFAPSNATGIARGRLREAFVLTETLRDDDIVAKICKHLARQIVGRKPDVTLTPRYDRCERGRSGRVMSKTYEATITQHDAVVGTCWFTFYCND